MSTKVIGLATAAMTLVAGSFVVAGATGQSAGASAPAQAAQKVDVTRALRAGNDVFGPRVTIPSGRNRIARATCPRGTLLTGGGGFTNGFNIFITDSYRLRGRTWVVRGTNDGPTRQRIGAFARCI